MKSIQLKIAIVLGLLSVMIGAFGAHAFKPFLETHKHLDTFETASKYLIYGSFSIFVAFFLNHLFPNKWFRYAANAFIIGTFVFCVSLYLICLTHQKIFGAIAPVGGISLMLAWVMLLVGVCQKN
ncbi:MAG: DUF423 domain-containing protein [Pseudarcicella sp.]|jgi:uncharacterized membrane protein YgdD (TMEM256/DUF423 family)|nr:DUF423 domain-containing protein [Pseudarcicella sp.]MBP6411203.1 DUF423 domain-containing protein [Pseudarcicella sp.]